MTHHIVAVGRGSQLNRLIGACVFMVSLMFGTPTGAAGQSQPVIFQHGGNSDASSWQQTADRLATSFNLTPHRYTTGSLREYEAQAAVFVSGSAGLPDTTFAVGHSNGGIVSREASRQGRNLRAIVTVGTLHRGAGLARSVLNGDFSWYIGYLLGSITLPIIRYRQYYDDSRTFQVASSAAEWAYNFGIVLQEVPNVFGLVHAPLLIEMAPGSTYREGPTGLNSAANLAREAAAIPNRIGIVSTLSSNDGVVFRTVFSHETASSLVTTRNLAAGAFAAAYFYYYFYDDYYDPDFHGKVNNSYMWLAGAEALTWQDQDWCALIGALYSPFFYECTTSDAIVSGESQVFPQYTRLIAQSDVSHVEETSSDVTFRTLSDLFRSGPLRIAAQLEPFLPSPTPLPVPPAPLVGSVQGPPFVPQFDRASWSAGVSGGQTPYTYVWSVDGLELQRGPGAVFYYTNQGFNFTVSVSIGDAAGRWVSRSLDVNVRSCDGSGIICSHL